MMGRRRRNPEDEILIANVSGVWVDKDGTECPYYAGRTRVRASHPLAKAIPGAFDPMDVQYDVEEATASPGERRGG